MMRPLILALVAGLLALGCDKKDAAKPADDGKITLAVIPKGTTHEFWKSIHAGAAKAAAELDVKIIWKGPQKEDDRAGQISVMEQMVIAGVKGIVLAPLDNTALARSVEDAARKKIPVIVIDSGLNSDQHISFVATDNHKGGLMGGEHLAKLLGGKGKVVLLRYQEGSASTMEREQGFLDAMAKFPDIQIVSSDQRTGATVAEAYEKAEQLLSRFKTADGLAFDGVFTPCEPVSFAMMKALEDNKLADKVKHVGFDASPKLVEGLTAKRINALVVQNPVNMGYLGVKTMVQHLKGEKVEKRIDTGVSLVTPDNMNEPAYKELLHPELDKWLK